MIYHPILRAIRPIQYGPINPIKDDIYPVEVTFYSDAGGLGGICMTKVNYMPEGITSGNTSGDNIHFRSKLNAILDNGLQAKSNS